MTPENAQLIVDVLNLEDALLLRGDREGLLLAAALATYRRRVEKEGGYLRLQPDPALDWLKYIEIRQGNGWLKILDTRIKNQKR